ncbi:hypothetical protein C7R16_05240 [Staphylococcus aureus]|nr:hypothetical protein SAKOR_00391 [Staphylococcus aureus subsp. aureus CN1]AUN01149.1 hypothetical protein A7U44_03640 [Staphylococcus aureus]AXF99861.1 hypothetical protein DU470_01895 [Staphylococcus aureus]AXG02552.1 hypothetical protein DU471_01775 [Staphylococcus aureus]MBM0756340.1 hypothetical protein [Staphylococcus aureus]
MFLIWATSCYEMIGVIYVEIGVPISLCWGPAVNYCQYKIVEPTILILCPRLGFLRLVKYL